MRQFYVWEAGQMNGPYVFKEDQKLEKKSRLDIKSAMGLKKISTANLAKKIQVKPQQLGMWIRGERNPSIRYLEKIKRALGVDLVDLFTTKPND